MQTLINGKQIIYETTNQFHPGNFNCHLGDVRRSLLRNEIMFNIYSDIFDVSTKGKTSVTTNKQWF